jgi:putative flippase GtrA
MSEEMKNKMQKATFTDTILRLWKKYEELIRYIVVGGLTTALNYGVYAVAFLLLRGIPGDYRIANTIAFVAAVLFAYFANKKAVFHSKTSGALDAAREAGSFFLMRLASYGVEFGLMELMVRVLHIDELLAKLPVNVLIVALNYVFSKLFIFRKPKEVTKEVMKEVAEEAQSQNKCDQEDI